MTTGHTGMVFNTQMKGLGKMVNPEYPLEGLMLKLKLQYFGHVM